MNQKSSFLRWNKNNNSQSKLADFFWIHPIYDFRDFLEDRFDNKYFRQNFQKLYRGWRFVKIPEFTLVIFFWFSLKNVNYGSTMKISRHSAYSLFVFLNCIRIFIPPSSVSFHETFWRIGTICYEILTPIGQI